MIRRINLKNYDSKTLKSMGLNFLIKGGSYLLTFIYVSLVLEYLGDEQYGLWATILSVMAWINLCDVGVGGGLRNILTAELSEGYLERAKKSVSTAYVVLSVLSLIIWAFLFGFSIFFDWSSLFNTIINIDTVMLISYSFICVNFVLALANVVLYSLQISEKVGLINLLGNLINIFGILLLRQISSQNMVYISILYGISTFIPLLANNIFIFKKYSFLKPGFAFFDKTKTHDLLSLGIVFFILQMSGIMLSTTDNIIISKLFGAINVTPIDVSTKLLSVVKGFYTAMIIPIWARTTKAFVENDHKWLNNMFKQLVYMLILFGMGIVLIVLLFKPITFIWLKQNLNISFMVVIVIALGTFAEMVNASFSSILNGMNLMKIQLYIAIIQIIVNIPLSVLLARNIGLGPMGVKTATTLLFIFSGLIYSIYTYFKIRRQSFKKGEQ